MNRLFVRKYLAALAVLFLLAPWAAAETKPYIVIVGIDQYADKAIKPRNHAENDAKLLFDTFTEKKYLGATAEQVKLLLGTRDEKRGSEVATRENILKAMNWAVTNAREDDLIVVAWFGQGAPVGDRVCYFASNSTLKDRATNAIGAGELEELFTKEKSTRVCVMMDVHFRGYDAGDERIPEHSLDRRFSEFDGTKDGSDDPAKPIVVLSAGSGLDPSIELEKNGLFAAVVAEALQGAADTEGGEPDGIVTVDELVDFVRKEVSIRSLKMDPKKEQRALSLGRSTHFALTNNPGAAEQVAQRITKFEKLIKDRNLRLELAKEGANLLTRMPRLDAERKLRKMYQELVDGKLALEQFEKDRAAIIDGLKLARADAEKFADRVLAVARIAEQRYVRELKTGELAAAAVKGLFTRLDEKLPKELAERIEDVDALDRDGIRTLLADARQLLGNREDLKGEKAVNMALDSMLHSLDNYSTYIDPETKFKFDQSTKQVFIGVGVQIQKDLTRDMVRISTPLRGSPGYKAGLKTGDLITGIINTVDKKGDPLAEPVTTSTKGLTIEQVVDKILGKEGTEVTLIIEREEASGPKELQFKISRGRVEVETVFGVKRKADDSWEYYLDPKAKIAYLRLDQFAQNTSRDLKAALDEIGKTGIGGLILDLRFNPGGYLESARTICDLFIDDGLIVTIKPRAGRPAEIRGQRAGSLLDFPMVVLVNGQSASASEIVSACLQDHERAIVMGERSFGKGSVQNIYEVDTPEGKAEVKLTTASFWRPSGKNLNKTKGAADADEWGVHPHKDYTIKLTPSERGELFEHLRRIQVIPRRDAPKKEDPPAFTDRQLEKALEYLRERVTVKTSIE